MLEHLTKDTFKEKVFNFDENKEWKFEGEKPCLIDFYADWCQPCKIVAPLLEELNEEYNGEINIYKVNTEQEQELAGMFYLCQKMISHKWLWVHYQKILWKKQ
jgi:thiol-disulfide isomerase/thioredoxin